MTTLFLLVVVAESDDEDEIIEGGEEAFRDPRGDEVRPPPGERELVDEVEDRQDISRFLWLFEDVWC